MMGTCKGCGTENVELNEMGMCANCAAKTDGGSEVGGEEATPGDEGMAA